jgi:phosphoheptose isomerase
MLQFRTFVDDYYRRFAEALGAFDRAALEPVLGVLEGLARTGGTLWVAGNGGSAAVSDHTTCDTTKGTFVTGQPPIRSLSLASNGPMLTALANDSSYAEVFSRQLEYYLKPGDAVLLVSSSGNSPNVVKACEVANARGVATIAFVGFRGGRLREIARHVVWIPVENYGIVEDTHQSLIHVLTQYLRAQAEARAKGPSEKS